MFRNSSFSSSPSFIILEKYKRIILLYTRGFPGGSEGKTSACKVADPGSIPGSGRSLEKEMATHSSILAWGIQWMEEPGRLQSRGVAKSQTWLSYFTFTFTFTFYALAANNWEMFSHTIFQESFTGRSEIFRYKSNKMCSWISGWKL